MSRSTRTRIMLLSAVLFLVTLFTYTHLQTQTRHSGARRRQSIALALAGNNTSTLATHRTNWLDVASPFHRIASHEHDGVLEESILAKAFGLPEFNSRVFPYFYRATQEFDPEDLTLTVFITPNRFSRLIELSQTWRGPISVVLHIPSGPEVLPILSSLAVTYHADPSLARQVDVHLVTSTFDRQLNAWRNMARAYARTQYIMMLDIDLAIRTDLNAAFKDVMDDRQGLGKDMRDGNIALVVPAFEYASKEVEPENWLEFPQTKEELTRHYKEGTMLYFYELASARGQAPTNHTEYFSPTSTSNTYLVDHWKLGYEPYLIFKRDGPPWCDEQFIGFGHNKEACAGEMLLSGMKFHVLRHHFITHRSHVKDGQKSKSNELKRNDLIWLTWEKNCCMRYMDLLASRGTLHHAQKSLFESCAKHKEIKADDLVKASKLQETLNA